MAITNLGKGLAALVITGALAVSAYFVNTKTTWLQKETVPSTVPVGIGPITGPADFVHGGSPAAMKSAVATAPSSTKLMASNGCQLELWTIPWNATMGIHAANGGVQTTEGSIMAKNGVNLKLVRQDDYGKIQEAMLKFADGVKKGEKCPQGAAFAVIMGDGYSGFASGLDEQFSKISAGFEVITHAGYSSGEDKCMLPYEVAKNPQKARGMTVGGVPRDGDINICLVWAGTNGIPFNPDGKTYDPDALNIMEVSSFTESDEKYITGGGCEERPIVRAGKVTGEKKQVCVDGVATWTPGDVTVAKKKGGLASVASTKEYAFQMPAIVIGNRDYMKRDPKMTEGLIRAVAEGGELVKTSEAALNLGASVSAQVYGEQDAAYWKKYYKGVIENDAKGVPISLGGSRVSGYADNAYLFGLNGNDNLFKRIYTQFGQLNAKLYPKLTPSFPKYESVVNTTYLASVLKNAPVATKGAAAAPTFDPTKPMEQVVGRRAWGIEFETGKATIRPESVATLEEMLNQIAITKLAVEVRGHTDNIGSQESNLKLSRARAEAVKTYLMSNAASGFPSERVKARGLGDAQPVADNATNEGRSKNRRVEVILGTTGN